MPMLTRGEIDALLHAPTIARLATVRAEGTPYIVPVWQHWEDGQMHVIPRARARFVEHIRVNPNVAISCANDVDPAHQRVLIAGPAEIVEGPVPMAGRMLEIAREMAHRYAGADGLAYLERTAASPRYLVRIVPARMTTWQGAWHRRYAE